MGHRIFPRVPVSDCESHSMSASLTLTDTLNDTAVDAPITSIVQQKLMLSDIQNGSMGYRSEESGR